MIFNRDFLIIAHRGASFDAPENTMAAFQLAYRLKADMIELDLQLTSDGVPVVFHDTKLDKKTDGTGLVNRYRLNELKMLNAGGWFSGSYTGEKIPTLSEVLDWAKGRILVNIEIKPEAVADNIEGGIEEKTVSLVKKFEMENKVLISSFDYRVIKRIKDLEPAIKTGLLYHKNESKGAEYAELVRQYDADFFHCSHREVREKEAALLRNKKIPFLVYTVNTPSLMKKMIRFGASGIFTDKPGLLYRISQEC